MSDYLTEAFQKLRLVEDDFDLSADANKIDELKSFVADDIEVPEEEVIDVEAVSEDDLEDNYNGKVILECECCHSRIYKDKDEVFIDDESNTANIDEECPVCNNTLGYSVIGKIEPYEKAKEIEVNVNDEDEVEPELESLNKTYKGGIKIKEDLEEIKDDELPDDDIEVEEGSSKKKLTEAPWVWQPDEDEPEEPDSPMPEDEFEDEDDYEEDGVPFINGKYTPGPLTQEVIDALYESGDYFIENSGLESDWDKDIWGLEYLYDSMENSGDPESGMSITIEESPEADGDWYRDDEFVDTGALINTLRRYVLIGLEKKYGQEWKDILDSHPEKSWYMDYNNIPEPTVAKDRQEMIDGAKAVIKAAREEGSFEESCKPKRKIKEGYGESEKQNFFNFAMGELDDLLAEAEKQFGEDSEQAKQIRDKQEIIKKLIPDKRFNFRNTSEEGKSDLTPRTLYLAIFKCNGSYQDFVSVCRREFDKEAYQVIRSIFGYDKPRSSAEERVIDKLRNSYPDLGDPEVESYKSRKGKKIKESKLQENIWTKLVKAFPELDEEVETCPECGKSPCECEGKELTEGSLPSLDSNKFWGGSTVKAEARKNREKQVDEFAKHLASKIFSDKFIRKLDEKGYDTDEKKYEFYVKFLDTSPIKKENGETRHNDRLEKFILKDPEFNDKAHDMSGSIHNDLLAYTGGTNGTSFIPSRFIEPYVKHATDMMNSKFKDIINKKEQEKKYKDEDDYFGSAFDESCSKKSKKGSAWDKLKKKNPELKEQKLTEDPWTTETRWVWKDEPKNSKRKDPHKRIYSGGHEFTGYYESDRIYVTAKDLGISDEEFNKNMDKIDKILTKYAAHALAATNILTEDPSLRDFIYKLSDYVIESLGGYEGDVDYYISRSEKHPQTNEPAIKISVDDVQFGSKSLRAIENSSEIDQAVEALLNDPEWVEYFKEEGKDIIETAGLPKNTDPLLAFCKFEAEIDEMPEEGPIGDFLAEFDPEDEIEFDEDDFVERLGEVALEKFGHKAWAKCKLRPGDFYDFGESFKESVEVTAKGEDNVNVSKNDDGSMDINVSSTEPGEGEEIVPLEDEEITEIEGNEPEGEEEEEIETEEGEEEAEGSEEETAEEGSEEVGEFDEEEFDNMGESYMRRVYSNVKSYHTTSVGDTGSELIIEGIISFKSGSQKKTTFVLKNLGANKHGKRIFEGYNKTFSNSSKAFRITGGLDKGRYYPRTFRYNYKTKTINESNKSEVFGVKGLIKAENCRKRHGR